MNAINNKKFLNSLFCAGYELGHKETIERYCVDVLPENQWTQFDKEVSDFIAATEKANRGTSRTIETVK